MTQISSQKLITSADQISTEWLTEKLRLSGALSTGKALSIKQTKKFKSQASSFCYLTIEYSQDAPSSSPQHLLLKMSNPDFLPMSDREFNYYTQIAPAMLNPPTVRCYDAAYNDDLGSYHLLLEDVSESHFTLPFPQTPSSEQSCLIIDSLAKIHSFWWNHSQLGVSVGQFPSSDHLHKYFEFLNTHPTVENLSSQLRAVQQKLQNQLPDRLLARLATKSNLTFVHGDAHTWNFMLPRQPEFGIAYLIDWEVSEMVWPCWLGVNDLAYWLIPWWPPEDRRIQEQSLLRQYHERLNKYGVRDYSWNQCWDDYCLSVAHCLWVFLCITDNEQKHTDYPFEENVLASAEDYAQDRY